MVLLDNLDPAFLHTIVGILIGGGITVMVNLISKRKEAKWRVAEKLLDKRILAYEEIFDIVIATKMTISANRSDKDGNLLGYSSWLESKEKFDTFWMDSFSKIHKNGLWLEPKLIKELGFFQDYMMTLNNNIDFTDINKFQKFRIYIQQDFINIAANLDKEIKKFISTDFVNMKATTKYEWHKLPKEETLQRMNKTRMMEFLNQTEIKK